jgi:hypothetical protein
VGVHGHDHTVRHDGQDDAVLKSSDIHKPYEQPPENIHGKKVLYYSLIFILMKGRGKRFFSEGSNESTWN